MMKVYKYPEKGEWKWLLQRPYADSSGILTSVRSILEDVQEGGDEALKKFSARWDGVAIENMAVSRAEIQRSGNSLSSELKAAIHQAKTNIELFHQSQVAPERVIEPMPGVKCWRKSIAIDSVGLYIPGGTAPLFSTVLMLGVPAAIAGCGEVVLCTPAGKDGSVHSAILYAANLVGITQIYKVGGAQAIAAMAFGTETIPPVKKIFGPGNQYVTAAKQMVQQYGVAIDMPAGPSEVCVMADASADPAFVAADLLSQAEHGIDSQVLLVSMSEGLVDSVQAELETQLVKLPRKQLAQAALANSRAVILSSTDDASEMINQYAPEHLIINCTNADEVVGKIRNAGSVFIGPYSPESVGDYASGTNHTLPTAGYAAAYSGVSVDSFVKKITYQQLSQQGLTEIAATVMQMAAAEGLEAHANAVRIRLAP